jgi:hypothetical protein
MRQIAEREESSVRLLTLELSEDEVEVLSASLSHLLAHSNDDTLEYLCRAYRDEIEGIRDDFTELLNVPFLLPQRIQMPQLVAAD